MSKIKSSENKAEDVETKSRRAKLISELGDLTYEAVQVNDEIRRQNVIMQGINAKAQGIENELKAIDGK